MSAVSRGLVRQIEKLLEPLKSRIRDSIARAVVQRVSDGKKLQVVQLGVMDGEDLDDCERFQEYGFTSVPRRGAEAVLLCPNGDRGHPLVVAVDDRRHRLNDLSTGEVAVYNHTGARVTMKKSGDIEVNPAEDREVFVREPDGSVDRLVRKSEHESHRHNPPPLVGDTTYGDGSDPSTETSSPTESIEGTSVLRA